MYSACLRCSVTNINRTLNHPSNDTVCILIQDVDSNNEPLKKNMLFFIFVKYVCEMFPPKLIKLQCIDAKNDLYSCGARMKCKE